MKKKLVLSLGSNLGNRYVYLRNAIRHIENSFHTPCTCSSYYTTPPWGETNQAQFINMALYLETDLAIELAFEKLQTIEKKMGRVKTKKWGPRSIDIDLLFYENEIYNTEQFTIPHPHLHERMFVLRPLLDILHDFYHPELRKTIAQLVDQLSDNSSLFCK
jgi:2-amino-4-hydroxy-6-hydroxymethyldihydropteridine diphosphokinase